MIDHGPKLHSTPPPTVQPTWVAESDATTASAQNAYISNGASATVSVIDTTTNMVVGTPIPVGNGPRGVAITPDGSKVFVPNSASTTDSVIDTANNTVVATILGLNVPSAWRSPPTAARSMSPI